MRVSWVILTYNRRQTVERAVRHNLEKSGIIPDEIIHVDNGSSDGVSEFFRNEVRVDVQILNRENLGVAKGYNRGVVLATGSHIVITGCDRLMPDRWCERMRWGFENIPRTGLISCYTWPIERTAERYRDPRGIEEHAGEKIINAMPMEAKMYPRDILKHIGHLREDFGLYGWEDNEWAVRVEKHCKNHDLKTYIFAENWCAEHLGTEGVVPWNGKDDADYHAFKAREANDPKKQAVLSKVASQGNPYYTPYV